MKTIGDKLEINKEFLKHYREVSPKYILQILQSDMARYWSWGAHALTNLMGYGLRMKVQGFKHKGHVYILLNGGDLFDVYLTTTSGKIVRVMNDVYFDELANVIDYAVEHTGENYENDVKSAKYKI